MRIILFSMLFHSAPPRLDCFEAWQLSRKTRFRFLTLLPSQNLNTTFLYFVPTLLHLLRVVLLSWIWILCMTPLSTRITGENTIGIWCLLYTNTVRWNAASALGWQDYKRVSEILLSYCYLDNTWANWGQPPSSILCLHGLLQGLAGINGWSSSRN